MVSETFKRISIQELHPTFGAEVDGLDLSKPVEEDVFQEILEAITKYGVCVFRDTGLNTETQIDFASHLGELDDVSPYVKEGQFYRLSDKRLFDVSNITPDDKVVPANSPQDLWNKGNELFHVDSSFNPRRAGYCVLGAYELPPPGNGGDTEFADLRGTFDSLPESQKNELREKDYIASHSIWHSRKLASPDKLSHIDPDNYVISKHRLLQTHEPSGRETLYLASHIFRIDGLDQKEFSEVFDPLYAHATRPENVFKVTWKQPGDVILWDNRSVMHRGTSGTFAGKYRRDMRRCTVHDGSSLAWGLNGHSDVRQGLP